jgi:hypothetical protein
MRLRLVLAVPSASWEAASFFSSCRITGSRLNEQLLAIFRVALRRGMLSRFSA